MRRSGYTWYLTTNELLNNSGNCCAVAGSHSPLSRGHHEAPSFDALAALASGTLGLDPLSGHLFVFVNKRRDRIKILYWDRDGMAVWAKRLEAGSFRFPASADARPRVQIRAADFVMLLTGVDFGSVKRGKRYHRPVPQPTA